MWRRRAIEMGLYLAVACAVALVVAVLVSVVGALQPSTPGAGDGPGAGANLAAITMLASLGASVALLGLPIVLAAGWSFDAARVRFGARPVLAALAVTSALALGGLVALGAWWGTTWLLLPPAVVGFVAALAGFHARWTPPGALVYDPPSPEERRAIGTRAIVAVAAGATVAGLGGGGWALFGLVVGTFLTMTLANKIGTSSDTTQAMGCGMIFAMFLGVPLGLAAAFVAAPVAAAWAIGSFAGWWVTPPGRRWAWLVADLVLALAGGVGTALAFVLPALQKPSGVDLAVGLWSLAFVAAGVGPGVATALARVSVMPAVEQRLVTAHRARAAAAAP